MAKSSIVARRYLSIIKAVEKEAAEFDEERGRFCRGIGAPNDRGAAGRLMMSAGRKAEEKRAYANLLRSWLPFIEGELMSVADVMREVGRGNIATAMLGSADKIAAPGHERLRREWNRETNFENAGRALAEQMMGVSKGSLGRAREPRCNRLRSY